MAKTDRTSEFTNNNPLRASDRPGFIFLRNENDNERWTNVPGLSDGAVGSGGLGSGQSAREAALQRELDEAYLTIGSDKPDRRR